MQMRLLLLRWHVLLFAGTTTVTPAAGTVAVTSADTVASAVVVAAYTVADTSSAPSINCSRCGGCRC
jgi:hypothetical protein